MLWHVLAALLTHVLQFDSDTRPSTSAATAWVSSETSQLHPVPFLSPQYLPSFIFLPVVFLFRRLFLCIHQDFTMEGNMGWLENWSLYIPVLLCSLCFCHQAKNSGIIHSTVYDARACSHCKRRRNIEPPVRCHECVSCTVLFLQRGIKTRC